MDAPNAPNPANPNKQEPADQNQDQVPVGPAPAQGPVQIIQNVLIQPIPQPVPVQLAPCWCHAHSSGYLSKLDRKETRIFR